ncbi:hypothetical protein AA958_31600 [Streptomyces sp. CNQ-509]|nr:hypothetical protein AA958_31600 [Streptomyces sp. CNQ-509]
MLRTAARMIDVMPTSQPSDETSYDRRRLRQWLDGRRPHPGRRPARHAAALRRRRRGRRAGRPRRRAKLAGAPRADGWVRWSADWRPEKPGPADVRARATDVSGRTQPERTVPNDQGYLFDAVVRHPVTVA